MQQTATLDASVTGRHDWQVIGLVGVAHGASHFFQLVIPSLFVPLGLAFGLDFARLGLLMSAFFVVSGLGQASSGFLVDRIGGRPVLWFGLSCFVVAGLLLGSATGYTMLMTAAVIAGIGNSVFHPADFSLLNQRVSQPRLGHAFGLHGLTGNLGWALAPVFITSLTLLAGWRVAAFGAAALVAVVLLITVLGRNLLGDPRPHATEGAPAAPSKPPMGALATLAMLASNPALWMAFLFFAFTSVALSSIQNYTLPILGGIYDLSSVVASSALSGYMLAAACGTLVGGFLASAQPRSERVVAVSLLLAGAALMVLAAGWVPQALVLPALAFAGLCSGIAGPSRDMLIRRVAPKGASGSVYGLVYSGMDTGGALAPLMFGVMLDAGWTPGPWLGAGVAFWLSTLFAAWIGVLSRRRPVAA